jgi:dTDP-4-amino-4,6-dideoxygalactose transaminase
MTAMADAVNVPFVDLKRGYAPIVSEINAAIADVVDSGWFIMGDKLGSFEKQFADYCGVSFCIGVGNGLDAIKLLLQAYGIGPGDEVIVPGNTFIATWLAVSEVGATIVSVDPDPTTHNISPDLIRGAISDRTRCIIPVHLYGQPADMTPIMEMAAEHDLIVIEDNAQAQGALYKGRMTGSLGHAAATSFYPGKNLGAFGDGGAVVTNDAEIANRVRMLSNYGSSVKYKHDLRGQNSRLDEMQAAILQVKLKYLDAWNRERQAIAGWYSEIFANSNVHIPHVPEWASPVWHLYVIESDRRDELRSHLAKNGIQSVVHYPIPPHLQACYSDAGDHSHLLESVRLSDRVLSLPIFPGLTRGEVEHTCAAVLSFDAG